MDGQTERLVRFDPSPSFRSMGMEYPGVVKQYCQEQEQLVEAWGEPKRKNVLESTDTLGFLAEKVRPNMMQGLFGWRSLFLIVNCLNLWPNHNTRKKTPSSNQI